MSFKDTETVTLKFSSGEIDEKTLRKIGLVMKKYHIPLAKVRGRGSMTLAGIKKADLAAVRKELGLSAAEQTQKPLTINFCMAENCLLALADCKSLTAKLEKELDMALPRKVKVAVSGCSHCCMQSMLRDIGFIATAHGWTLTVGGSTGGLKPRVANVAGQKLTEEQAVKLAKKLMQVYAEHAKPRERIGSTIDRIGWNTFKNRAGC